MISSFLPTSVSCAMPIGQRYAGDLVCLRIDYGGLSLWSPQERMAQRCHNGTRFARWWALISHIQEVVMGKFSSRVPCLTRPI